MPAYTINVQSVSNGTIPSAVHCSLYVDAATEQLPDAHDA